MTGTFDISERTFQTFLLHGAYGDPSGRFQSCTHQTAPCPPPVKRRHLGYDLLSATLSPQISEETFFKKTELKVQGAISLEPIISTSSRLPEGFLKVLQGLNLP